MRYRPASVIYLSGEATISQDAVSLPCEELSKDADVPDSAVLSPDADSPLFIESSSGSDSSSFVSVLIRSRSSARQSAISRSASSSERKMGVTGREPGLGTYAPSIAAPTAPRWSGGETICISRIKPVLPSCDMSAFSFHDRYSVSSGLTSLRLTNFVKSEIGFA